MNLLRSSRNPLKIRASLGPKSAVSKIIEASQSLKDQGKSRTAEDDTAFIAQRSQSLKDQGKSRTCRDFCYRRVYRVAIP